MNKLMVLVCVMLLSFSSLGYAKNDKVQKTDAVKMDMSHGRPSHKMRASVVADLKKHKPNAVVYGSEITPEDFARLIKESNGDEKKFRKNIAKLSKKRIAVLKKAERSSMKEEVMARHNKKMKKMKKEKK